MLIIKTDLLPHLDFDVEALVANARKVNPGIKVLKVSAQHRRGHGRMAGRRYPAAHGRWPQVGV